jgi:hypothetical protein
MGCCTLKDWFSVANHEPHIGRMLLWLMLSGIWLLFTIPAASNLPFLLNAEVVSGKVVSAPLIVDRVKFGPKYSIRFEYSDSAGKVYTGAGRVWSADELKPGDAVPVRYLRSDPSRSRLEANVWEKLPAIGFAVAGLGIAVAAIWHGITGIRRVNAKVCGSVE